jgi:hypothetical protein
MRYSPWTLAGGVCATHLVLQPLLPRSPGTREGACSGVLSRGPPLALGARGAPPPRTPQGCGPDALEGGVVTFTQTVVAIHLAVAFALLMIAAIVSFDNGRRRLGAACVMGAWLALFSGLWWMSSL